MENAIFQCFLVYDTHEPFKYFLVYATHEPPNAGRPLASFFLDVKHVPIHSQPTRMLCRSVCNGLTPSIGNEWGRALRHEKRRKWTASVRWCNFIGLLSRDIGH